MWYVAREVEKVYLVYAKFYKFDTSMSMQIILKYYY